MGGMIEGNVMFWTWGWGTLRPAIFMLGIGIVLLIIMKHQYESDEKAS